MSDAYVRPDVRAFLDQLAANKAPPLGSVPIEQSRAMFRATRPLIEAEAMPVRHVVDMQYEGPAGPLAMRCYDDRDERGDGTAIVFIHGGGFTLSDIDEYDSVAREYARLTLLPVFSIDYRLAPEHPFPAAPDDCEAAIRFIASDSITLPFEITDLVLSGDSAGGNLAIVTTLALLQKPARVPVIALAPIYPAVSDSDRSQSLQRFGKGYMLEKSSLRYFMQSYAAPPGDPRHHVIDTDLSALPPTLVMTATLDPLHDQGIDFVETLRQANVPFRHYEAEGNIHGLITCRKICPSSQGDLDIYLAMLVEMLNGQDK